MLNTKTHFHLSWRQVLALLGLIGLVTISRLDYSPAQTVIQGYDSDQSLQAGMLVSTTKDASKVEATTNDNLEHLRGVVVNPNDAPVTLSVPNQKVFVASTGTYTVLVNNQNGAVHINDYVSVSSLPGIAMKARSDQKLVVGRAIEAFDGVKDVASTTTVKDEGVSKQVAIGKIAVDVNIIRNPVVSTDTGGLPGFLQNASSSVAGKSVSANRVYLAATILLISAIISGSMLYAGVRSGIVSIGRNPLSRKSIVGGLVQVTITSLIIFIGGLFGVYLLLKL